MANVVYFDTSAWNHLYNGAVIERPGWDKIAKPSDLSTMRRAVRTGAISIPVSVVVLEELMSAEEDAEPRIGLVFELSDWSRPLKPPNVLLTDDISSYASRGYAASPILQGKMKWQFALDLPRLLLGRDQKDVADRKQVIAEARQQKEKFHAGMVESGKWALSLLERNPGVSHSWTFDMFWDQASRHAAQEFAKRAGVLEECKERGFDGLLQIPSVRMAVGSALSLTFAQAREKSAQAPRPQDSRDLHHATMAASRASLFVTDDKKLLGLVRRVPMVRFEAVQLREFLDRLERLTC